MATIRTILLGMLIFTLLFASDAKRRKSSRRLHKKALPSDHGSPPSTKEHSGRYQNLLAENDVSGVSRVDENTWKWRTKSVPVQVDTAVTRRILEGPHDSLSFSMEVRPGSKKTSTVFHAFSNFHRAGHTTWLEVLVDSIKNIITVNHRTPTLSRNSIGFTLPGSIHRNWIKLFVVFRKANERDLARITCQVSCSDVMEQNITDGINLVLPADTTFELGGNSQNTSTSFGGQIRKARVYLPSIFAYPWKCNNEPPEPSKGSSYTHKKRGLPADEPDISRILEPVIDMESLSARTALDDRHERDIEELRLEIKSCRDENAQLNTMMQMMKQKQLSLEERIATLETCECIPMCLMRDGHKKRHGEIWKVNECKTCECTNGRTECENEEGCGEEIHACLSDPCANDGICKEVDDGYLCRCRRGFYGDHCEHIDRCDEGICQNGAECELLEEGGYRCLCKDGFTGRNCEQPLDHCRSVPCRNSAECVNTLSGYICNCRDGFSGSRCQDSDDCYSEPCLNGGACTSLFRGGYTCRCNSGFYGRNCELRDVCFSSPCLNEGRCRQVRDSLTYTCDCPEHFHGERCQFKDACFTNPCLNGGRCRTGPLNGGTFTCECKDGFHGDKCEDEDACFRNPCLNGGRCRPGGLNGGRFTCECREGFHGDRCEDEDACFRNPCLNGGRCRPGRLNGGSFTCECREGFHGDRCHDEDACFRNPCLNGGRCRPGELNGGTFTCECREGFHGDRCQDEDACFRNPCMNGGKCRSGELNGGTYTCECREGFHGDRCQDRDACASNPCLNGGRCTSEPINGGTFKCECREGFHGVRCQDEDACVSNPCLNGGRCIDRVSPTGARYTCQCPVSYSGPRCEIVDACYAEPCQNGGQCIPLTTGASDRRFTCRCTDGFYGDRCELRAPCASNPCLNGGVCENRESGRYFCRCRATNYGDRCELTDYCRARPCKNEARCINSPSEYGRPFTCDCRDLFAGPLCEFEDLCRRRPCLHDGTCRMEDGNYVCECQDSFFGKRCEKSDFCAENPCLNGGRCENEESGLGYECICPDSHTGDRCQQRHPCRPNPCLNNGRCRMTGPGSYACECPPSHTGPNCRLVDHCRSNPCLNRGICLNNRDTFECDCLAGFDGNRCQNPNQCASNPCQNGGKCVEENGSYKCICPPAVQGDRCQYTCNVCAYLKEEGDCTGSAGVPETRWYFDKYTQKCQQFQFSGCGGNGNNFETRQACRQKCLVGVCCMLRHAMIEINGHTNTEPANYTCKTLSIGQCKKMDTQHREFQVIAFKAGVECEDYECGTSTTCSFGGEDFKINTRINVGCRRSCACRSGGNIRCRCDTKTQRSEIRRLTTEERKAFQNAVRTLKTTEIEQGRNAWDLMRDEYLNSYPVAQSSKYFLLWNRAFLKKMELLLQKVDCAVSIPFYDFTQDAGRFSEAVVWQPNFFGGEGNCIPDHPFRLIENHNALQWKPCLTRNFSTSVSIPCMIDIATALSSRTYEQLSGRLQALVSHVNAFIGGDMATSTKAYDPLFYSIHAFIDNLFMIWQKNHPGNNELKHVRGVENIPFGMHPEDLWDGACVEYSELHEAVACNRADTSEELFATDGYNLQGYNRQGFDRDDFDKTGYNALGRDRVGRLDTRSIYKYDGFDADGYGRDGYDRRGCDRFGFNKKGRDRDGFNTEGYDMAGYNRYGLDADGFSRRGFDVYGRNRYGKLDDSNHYDEETGFNDCCFGRDGITPSGYDRFGFNVEGHDKNSCKYFFNGPHSLHYREKLWEMLSPQRASFLTSVARTCGPLKNLPKNQISLNWVNSPAYQASKLNSRKLQIRDSKAESMNHLMSKRFCFDVDMFLTWCPCLEPDYPAICSTNPCADANCPLHPDARCVINMCGRTCTAGYYLDGRRVNCDNPCSPNPCQNGGRCEPSRYSSASERFQCHCPDEYTGSLCEKPAPDTCMLSKKVGKCQATVTRWYYNFKAAACEEFIYSGCGGNSNNFPSKRACDLRCSLGACCYRLPRNLTFQVGYDRDGFDKYGFNALGFNRRGQQRSAHDSMPTGNRIHPPKGFGPDGYDIFGYDLDGYDRQGYNRDGYHRDTGFNRKGFDPEGKYDQLREFDKNGYDNSGFDRAGFTCSGINRKGFNQLGLYYDFNYHCESLLLSECEALKDPGQLEIPFEVISFSPGSTCDEVKCGEECGCQVNGHIYHFGQNFRQGCESCTCTLGGVVECTCQRLGRRREIRDLTKTEREDYAAAIRKLYKSNKWEEFATQHAQYMPKANGVASSLPWHRYFLRMIEQEIQKVSNCEIFIPYFDWTIDVGSLENSQVWQASFFGGDGDEETNCVYHHLFAREVRWHPCIKRKFDKTISLPDAVNFHLLLQEPNYDNFRLQLEMMSSLFHLYVGGHMASPFSPYDPLYLSHWAFIDFIWNEWQKKNPMGLSRFPAKHRYMQMMPFVVTPDNVLSSEKQMCVIYIPPTIGSLCNTTVSMRWPPSIRDETGLDRHGFDEHGYDVDGYNIRGIHRSGRTDVRDVFDANGYDTQGYQRSGFDASGWDRHDYNKMNFDRDGFDVERYDASGYNRYGFDRDGKTPFGMFKNMTFAKGFDSGYAASLFDRDGYNIYGFDKNGFSRKGFDAFSFNSKGLDQDNCDYYNHGPHYMRYFYHVQEQLSLLNKEMLKNVKRICPPISSLPEYWASHIWLEKMPLARSFEKAWAEYHEVDASWEPRTSSVTEELLWLPVTPDRQFCFNMNWFSGCPLGSRLMDCKEDRCAQSSCASHPKAKCRMKNCGACYPEFYDGKTGEIFQCYGCVAKSGKMHNEGSTWHEGCNTCVCQAGLIACSPMPCLSHACSHPAPGPDGCCDVCNNCEYEDRVYRNHQRFRPNSCETCECIDGSVMCNNAVSNCPPVACSTPVKLPDECCPTCSTDCRGHRNRDSWIMDKCHNCSCVEDKIVCSKNRCPVIQCSHPRTSAGECCPKCMGCEYKGKNYRHMQNFMENSCSQCSCRFGSVMCTTQQCPPLTCKHKEKTPGACCSRCRRGCEYEGVFYDNGISFQPRNNPCLECSCQDGQPKCLRMTCPRVDCSRPIIPDGKCCPQCASCLKEGVEYREGQMWTSDDRCKRCVCQRGEEVCRNIIPCRDNCLHGIVRRGQCCPDCSRCSYHGKIFQHLEPFTDPEDVCKRCTCQSGNVVCSNIECPQLRCGVRETPEGECCPRCKSCVYEGALREHGSSWRIPQYPCTTCTCREGQIDCEDEQCPPARCDYPSTPDGSCCPVCRGCSYRGRTYSDKDAVKADDRCSSCHCIAGDIVCRKNTCPVVQCTNPVRKPGACCQSCATCEYDGQTYEDGRVFIAPRSPCLECTCRRGEANCHRLDLECAQTLCSNPGRNRTQCCPTCDSCEYERRNYNDGATFMPIGASPCVKCTCRAGTVQCNTETCPPISCPNPVRKPGTCCSVCEECVQDGRTYNNGQKWKSDTCTECRCSAGNIRCKAVSCPIVTCSHPAKLSNECCPSCAKCFYNGQVYSEEKQFQSPTDRCQVCTCRTGTVTCIRRSCSRLDCPNPVRLGRACCPTCPVDCEYMGVTIANGATVNHPDESCTECTCTDGRVQCERRRCTREVGCTHPTSDGCCRDVCDDCRYLGSVIKNGQNTKPPGDSCRTCTCTNGNVVCLRQRCPTPKCENPKRIAGKCCPECPEPLQGCEYEEKEMSHGNQFENRCRVCNCYDGDVTCRAVSCPPARCSAPVKHECCLSCNHGCSIGGVKYKEGQVVKKQNGDKCNVCHCVEGSIVCKQRKCQSVECSNPRSDGCCPVCQGCRYEGEDYGDETSFPDPDDKCTVCTCKLGNVDCVQMKCEVSCTHPLSGDCCPTCGSDCLLDGKIYRQNGGMFTLPSDEHQCQMCVCDAGSIVCKNKPCPKVLCRNPVVNECGCPSCTDCLYNEIKRSNKETFANPENEKCSDCYCSNGNVVCGQRTCKSSSCTHPVRDDCDCPRCDQCLYYGRTYERDEVFQDAEDKCNSCECQDGSVMCESKKCVAVSCTHPSTDECGCTKCDGCSYGGVEHDNLERFTDPANKCNKCTCQNGVVSCTRAQCIPTPCSNPVMASGECCPKCIGMCHAEGKSYEDGASFTKESDPCSICSCSSGNVRCVRQRCDVRCTHPIAQSQCCPDCSACLYQGLRHEEGDAFIPIDNNCKQCFCHRGNVICNEKKCPEPKCENPRPVRGSCCPKCPEAQSSECFFNGLSQKTGARWIQNDNFGQCQECTCFESGITSCATSECDTKCTNPVPQLNQCCPVCGPCYYGNRTYNSGTMFQPDGCNDCICTNGNVKCVRKECQPLTCPTSKQVKIPGDCCPRCQSCVMAGKIYSDHQSWTSQDDPCQECYCLNGVVTCAQVQCLQPCQMMVSIPGQCCPVCAGCFYNSKVFQIGESFEPNPMDPCETCECQASPSGAPVMCCKRQECPSLADCPRSCIRQALPGQCCPTCTNRPECAYGHCTPGSHGRQIVPAENRCYACDCQAESTWLCMREKCKKLDCPMMKRYTPKGTCCPVCDECHLDLANKDVPSGHVWQLSECEICKCDKGSIMCIKQECPQLPLKCDMGAVPYKQPGQCCHKCVNIDAPCTYEGQSVRPHHQWKADHCTTCTCFAGEVKCVTQRCRMLMCHADQAPTAVPGECCPRCMPRPASCTAFGDPHYKTFDGRMVHFQGTCQYLLTADCSKSEFKVIVHNTKNTGTRRRVSWTEQVTLITEGGSVALMKDYSVRVNGTIIRSMPVTLLPYFYIEVVGNYMSLSTHLGVHISWNGRQQRLEVTVPGTYRRRTCGLCGNFNNYPQDDTRLHNSRLTTSDAEFGNDWKVNLPNTPTCPNVEDLDPCSGANYATRTFANEKCKILRSPTFAACHALVNPGMYFAACVYDVCACGENDPTCLCDILEAYAAQCRRSGVVVRWRSPTLCAMNCRYDRGYVFDECGSPCKRTCANRNLPPGTIAAQCYLPCVSGCQCPAGKVEYGERCVYPDACPANVVSTIEEPLVGGMPPIQHMAPAPSRINRHSRLVRPPLVAPSRQMIRGHK